MNNNFFYKYRKILKTEDLESDPNIDALLNHYVMLSSRKEFLDKDDSRIELLNTLAFDDVINLIQICHVSRHAELYSWFNGIYLNNVGNKGIKKIMQSIDTLIDKYMIYCLASYGDSMRMWEEYADSHQGFCIEFKAEPIQGLAPIQYQAEIGKIKIIDLLHIYFTPNFLNEEFGRKIHKLLHIKKLDFQFEGEYRFIHSGLLNNGENTRRKYYNKDDVESIIFGKQMKFEYKEFLIRKLPKITFRQAVLRDGNIILEKYDGHKHSSPS